MGLYRNWLCRGASQKRDTKASEVWNGLKHLQYNHPPVPYAPADLGQSFASVSRLLQCESLTAECLFHQQIYPRYFKDTVSGFKLWFMIHDQKKTKRTSIDGYIQIIKLVGWEVTCDVGNHGVCFNRSNLEVVWCQLRANVHWRLQLRGSILWDGYGSGNTYSYDSYDTSSEFGFTIVYRKWY